MKRITTEQLYQELDAIKARFPTTGAAGRLIKGMERQIDRLRKQEQKLIEKECCECNCCKNCK